MVSLHETIVEKLTETRAPSKNLHAVNTSRGLVFPHPSWPSALFPLLNTCPPSLIKQQCCPPNLIAATWYLHMSLFSVGTLVLGMTCIESTSQNDRWATRIFTINNSHALLTRKLCIKNIPNTQNSLKKSKKYEVFSIKKNNQLGYKYFIPCWSEIGIARGSLAVGLFLTCCRRSYGKE